MLLSLTSGCKCTLRSRTACTACRWALSNHTCLPVIFCQGAWLGWETLDEAQKRKISQSRLHTQLCIQEYTQEYTPRHTTTTHALLNKHTTHTGDRKSLIFFFIIFSPSTASSSQFHILPQCPHFCSHIFWRTEPCERRSPLLKQIQTSIRQHMACLPVSDRWCRCTFQRDEPQRHSTAGKTMRTGREQDRTLHVSNKTGDERGSV